MKSTRHQLFSPPVDAFLGSSSSALHEALLQPILEHMEAGVTVYGLDGRILFFNEAAKRFGMSEPIDLHERTYGSYSFYHPDGSTPASFAELPSVRVLHQENVYNQEIWVQPPGKAVSILVANGKLLYASSGEPVGALIVTHDITERKWAQQRLEVSEQRYKSLFEHNPDIVCWLDLSGRFLNVNPAFESVTGYTMSDLRNQSFQRLLNREGVRRVLSMSRTIQQGASDNYDISAFHQNGTQIELNVTVVPIVVSQNVVGLFCHCQGHYEAQADRRDRADRPDRSLGAGNGLPAMREVAAARLAARSPRRQLVHAPASGQAVGADGPANFAKNRAASALSGVGDYGEHRHAQARCRHPASANATGNGHPDFH